MPLAKPSCNHSLYCPVLCNMLGAGMVGLVHAQAALGQAALLPILHLADVNPYVTGKGR